MSFASGFIKDTFKAPLDRIVDNFAQNVAAGVASAVVPSNAQSTGADLVTAGLAVSNAEDQTAAKVDAAIIGSANDYAAITGKDTARAAAADVSNRRVPELSGSFADKVIPQKKISNAFSGEVRNVYLLTDLDPDRQPYMRLQFGAYSRPNPFQPAEIKPEFVAFLPLPTEMGDMMTIDYSSSELDTVGDIANVLGSGTGAGTSAIAALMRDSDKIIDAGGKALGDTGIAGLGLVGGALQRGSKGISTVIEQALGVAPNPNPSLAFRGPSLRSYTFSWMFHPNNINESIRLQKFIRELKKRSLPSTTVANVTALLNYPQMCQVNLYPWDKGGVGTWGWSSNSFLRFKKSVIRSVNVNYAPNGVPSFFEHTRHPVFAAVSITFNEIEFFTSEDWSVGSVDEVEQSPISRRFAEDNDGRAVAGELKAQARGFFSGAGALDNDVTKLEKDIAK